MKKLITIVFLLSFYVLASAQGKDWGRVSASIESTNHIYVDDAENNFFPTMALGELMYLDGGRYATNNYIKVDYYKGKISTGLQVEGYFPTTVGYPLAQNKLTLSNLYFSWTDDDFSVTAGSFYEQLGSGLLFRSWEDRALGLNNAIVGARGSYNYGDMLSAKAFVGVPRLGKVADPANTKFFGLGLTDVCLAAADLSFSLSDCLDWDVVALALEGSILYKYENHLSEMAVSQGCKSDNIGWSARVNMDVDGFYLKSEYVDVGTQYVNRDHAAERGSAQLLEFGYNSRGLGVSVTGRRLHRMRQQIYTVNPFYSASANVLSYIPAMSTQYTYMLTTLTPYSVPSPDHAYNSGEIGGQIDAFYNFRRGTKIGGKRGMKVHANFSTYYTLNEQGGACQYINKEGVESGGELLFRDFSFDVEKQWTKKFKTTLLYSLQEYNHHERDYQGVDQYVGMSHTVVADLLYKWTPKFSTRLELQYLATEGYQKDWMAALLEVSFAPHWSVFASDMYNHGSSMMHYYNAGVSYAMRWLRVAAGYGRYRAGYICSGGVCRAIPAYTGANITLTASF